MGIDAVALLKVRRDDLVKGLGAGANGSSLRTTALEDATLVSLGAPFGTEPDELSFGLRKLVGDTLDLHSDPRGIFFLPDVARPRATQYDAVIDEVGEVGFWAPRVAKDYVPARVANAPAGSFEASMRDLMEQIPPDLMEQMERAMASGDQAAMAQLQSRMDALMASNEQLGRLVEQFGESLAQAQDDQAEQVRAMAERAAQMGNGGLPMDLPSENEAPELWAAARAQAEAMLRDNPEALLELAKQLGLDPDAIAQGFPGPGVKK